MSTVDPGMIQLRYEHVQYVEDDLNECAEVWRVSAHAQIESGSEDTVYVGHAEILVVELHTRDGFEALDEYDEAASKVGATIFDIASGELDPELGEKLELFGDRILVLNRVELEKDWRGYGLGPLLGGLSLRRLSGGAAAAFCYPAPLNLPTDDDGNPISWPEDDWETAVAKLGNVWTQLGFESFRDGVYYLDLCKTTLDSCIEESWQRVKAKQIPLPAHGD